MLSCMSRWPPISGKVPCTRMRLFRLMHTVCRRRLCKPRHTRTSLRASTPRMIHIFVPIWTWKMLDKGKFSLWYWTVHFVRPGVGRANISSSCPRADSDLSYVEWRLGSMEVLTWEREKLDYVTFLLGSRHSSSSFLWTLLFSGVVWWGRVCELTPLRHLMQSDVRDYRTSITSYFIFRLSHFPINLILWLYTVFRPAPFFCYCRFPAGFRFLAPADLVLIHIT